jgi:hypothetical protein
MGEFLEHGHTEWSDDRLFDEVQDVVELLKIPRSPEHRSRLQARLARATFEQMERYADRHPDAVILDGTVA